MTTSEATALRSEAAALRSRLERTSARALVALQEKDETISALTKELALERRRREHDEGWSNDENDPGARVSRNAKNVGGRREQLRLERALEDERAVVTRLRGELREARSIVETLRQSREETKSFAAASERHVEALTSRLSRLSHSRDERAVARETAAEDRERKLSARVEELHMELSHAKDDAESWKTKAVSLEAELAEIKRRVFPTDVEIDGEGAVSTVQLQVQLAETRLALREALAEETRRETSTRIQYSGDTLEREALVSTRGLRDASKFEEAREKISSLKLIVKELRSANAAQANEINRIETLLREQLATSKLTVQSAEAASESAARERERYLSALNEREQEVCVLRDAVQLLESEHATTIDAAWFQRELSKARDKIVSLEKENASLSNEKEILAGEMRNLRHEVKGESERANAFEAVSTSARERVEILSAQVEWMSEECYAHMESEIELLDRLDDAERDKLDLEISLKSCEQALEAQIKRMSDFSGTQLIELKRHVQQSVEEASVAHQTEKFCRAIQSAFKERDGVLKDAVREKLETALLEAQRTIARLEFSAIKHETAFFVAMRHIAKMEHRGNATKTAFDHVCSILSTSQQSFATFTSKAMSCMEKRLKASHSRVARLSQGICDAEAFEMEGELIEREEKIQLMQARIEELEITGQELLAARESAGSAMGSIAAARDNAMKELFLEQDRLRQAQRTIADLDSQVALLQEQLRASTVEDKTDALSNLVQEQARTIAAASAELERRVVEEAEARERLEETTRELDESRSLLERATLELESEREEARVLRERLAERESHSSNGAAAELERSLVVSMVAHNPVAHTAEELVAVALEDNRAAAVVAAAARRDAEERQSEIERLRDEIRLRDEDAGPARERVEARCEELNRAIERDTTALQAYADVMTAKLLNLEAEIAEQKRKEDEWLASNKPNDDERRAHVERCKRYRDLMERLRAQHEAEKAKLLVYVKESQSKIDELTSRVKNSWAGEAEAEIAKLTKELESARAHIATLEAKQRLAANTREGGYALLSEVESASTELIAVKSKLAMSVEETKRLRNALDKCASEMDAVREETKSSVEQQLTTKFRQKIARLEDDVSRFRERCQDYESPCVALVQAVRMIAVRLLRISAAVLYFSAKSTNAPGERVRDATEVASLVGLSVEDITSVYAANGASEDAPTSESSANVRALIEWCESRAAQLCEALTSAAPISQVWRAEALEDVTALVVERSVAAESCLRETTSHAWWNALESVD